MAENVKNTDGAGSLSTNLSPEFYPNVIGK